MTRALIINQAFKVAPAWGRLAMNGRSRIYHDMPALLHEMCPISRSHSADSFTFHSFLKFSEWMVEWFYVMHRGRLNSSFSQVPH